MSRSGCWARPFSATLGASGAVLGLVGALLVINRARGLDVTWILAYVAITAVISFTIPNISWEGHLGGFVTGAAVAWIFLQDTKRRRAQSPHLTDVVHCGPSSGPSAGCGEVR